MNITRRGFLKLTAAGAAALGISGKLPLKTLARNDSDNGSQLEGEWKATTCQGCTRWCPARVYVRDGRAVKVRANSDSLTSSGKLCQRGELSLQQVYDPDRVKVPMKRTNPEKGKDVDPEFVPISWEEAMDLLAEKIIELRENGEAHKFMLMRGRYSHLRDIIYSRMPAIIGSPNNISHSSICAEAEKMGAFYTENLWGYRDHDLKNSEYALLWGVDPVACNRQQPSTIKYLNKVSDRGGVAVVDPRLSASAAKADEWLPVVPGQDLALALAFAHVILTRGLWYKPFVGDFNDGRNRFATGENVNPDLFNENYTHGLVSWWNLELKDRTPAWAAERSGVPEEQIIKVATEFAGAAPHACVWTGTSMHPKGTYLALATHSLAGLVGSIDNKGGTLAGPDNLPPLSVPSADNYLDNIARGAGDYEKIDQRGRLEQPNLKGGKSGGGVNTNRVADAVLDEDPYDIKVAVGYFCNFVYSGQQSKRWEKAMEKIPFFAHLTTNYSEMSHYADLILPAAHHMMERWSVVRCKSLRYISNSIQQPLIEPVFDVRNDETEFVWLLGEALDKKGFPNLINFLKNEFDDPETGQKPKTAQEFALFALKKVTRNLWDPAVEKEGDHLSGWKEFVEKGVWNSAQAAYRKRWDDFGTKTGKFEFYSETLREALKNHADRHDVSVDEVLEKTGYDARGELAFIPHYETPRRAGERGQFPYLFIDYKSRLNREGRSQNCPWYYEFKGVDPGSENYKDLLQINPADAKKQGLSDGDLVKVSSQKGEPITCRLKTWEGIRPGCVAKPFGQGHWAYGRRASKEFTKKPIGANNNKLLHADWDYLSGSSARNGGYCRVKIERL